MAQLPTNRTTANTVADHLSDHNEVHRLHNIWDGFSPTNFDASGTAAASTAALAATLGTAARAQLSDIQTYVQQQAAATLAAANAYTDAHSTGGGNTVPVAPTIGTATPSAGQISIAFTANGTGGTAIIDFTATAVSSDGGATNSATGSASPIVIPGLTASAHYTVTVKARNAIGSSSASSASSSVQVPSAGGGGVNRAAPFATSAWVNLNLTGSETFTDAPIFGFGGTGMTTTLSAPLGSSSVVCTSTSGVLNLDGNVIPLTSQIVSNYYYGSRIPMTMRCENEMIIVVRAQDVNPGNAYIVQRGAFGTTAVAHNAGVTIDSVRHGVTSGDLPIYYSKSGDAGAVAYTWQMPDYNVPSYHRFRTAQTFTGVYGPSTMSTSTAGDHSLFVCDPTTGVYFEVWQGTITGTTVTNTNGPGWATGNAITGKGGDDLTQNLGVRASNTSIAAGTITGYDISSGLVGSANTTTLTDSGTPWGGRGWPTNTFAGYRVTTGSTAPNTGLSADSAKQASTKTDIYGDITSNTGTVLTVSSWKKVSDNSAASPPPANAPYWVTNTAKTITHALVLAVPGEIISQSTFTAPATSQLGGNGFGPYPNGQRFAIPVGTTKPTTLSFFGSMVWDVLVAKGLYIMDYCGGHNPTIGFDRESVPQVVDKTGIRQPLEVEYGGYYPNYEAGPNWDSQGDWDKIAPFLQAVTYP